MPRRASYARRGCCEGMCAREIEPLSGFDLFFCVPRVGDRNRQPWADRLCSFRARMGDPAQRSCGWNHNKPYSRPFTFITVDWGTAKLSKAFPMISAIVSDPTDASV